MRASTGYGPVMEDLETRVLEDLVNPGDIAMLTTLDATQRLLSRPLTVARVRGGALEFLIDVTADWAADADSGRQVNAAIAAGGRNDWVSISGRATISQDRSRIDDLWSAAAAAYFDSRDAPEVGVLQVVTDTGEFWSSPSGGPIGRLLSIIGAATGQGDAAGGHGTVV
jgi:general stress protein 26